MKIYHYVLFMMLMATLSCQSNLEDDFEEAHEAICEEKTTIDYSISIDSALVNLQDFMKDEQISTRSGQKRQVKNIYPLSLSSNASRSAAAKNESNLVYIANFEDEQGFAILAADERINEKVLAITENGSLPQESAYAAVEMTYQERPVFPNYPLDGPGFFTTAQTGDEIFMNPNTVDLYDAEKDEYMIGNLEGADDQDETNLTRSTSLSYQTDPQLMMCGLCVKYAEETIEKFKDEPMNPNAPIYPVGPQGPNVPQKGDWTSTSTTPWNVTGCVSPMLSNFTSWYQGTPFNDLFDEKKDFWSKDKRKASAGCFPLAIAKVFTYFKRPSLYTYMGYTVDWDVLYTLSYSTLGNESASHLLLSIAKGCDCLCFYNGTFTWPWKATAFMKKNGYSNAHSIKYGWNQAIEMLDKGTPLVIYGMPGIAFWDAHAWNIDGYKTKVRTTTTNKYSGQKLVSSSSKDEICNMVHCCFGWEGAGDGYYVSGIFNTDDTNVEFDIGKPKDKRKFNTILHLVVYDKPL